QETEAIIRSGARSAVIVSQTCVDRGQHRLGRSSPVRGWPCCVWLRYDRRRADRDGRMLHMAEELLDANAAQRRYWNTVAGPRWVAAPGFRERRNQESTALLLARLGITGGENVLEIGCGTGALTVPLAAAIGNHGRLVAIDISEPMLGVARQRVEERGLHNVTLLLGDAQVFDRTGHLRSCDLAHGRHVLRQSDG